MDRDEALIVQRSWTTRNLARHWAVSIKTIRRFLERGQLRGFKIGRKWRIYHSEVMLADEHGIPELPKEERKKPKKKQASKGAMAVFPLVWR